MSRELPDRVRNEPEKAFMDNSAFKSASSLFSKLNHPDAAKLEKSFQ